MPAPSQLIDTVTAVTRLATTTGVVVRAVVRYASSGEKVVWEFVAPREAAAWPASKLDTWLRDRAYERVESMQSSEIDDVMRRIRGGENPLRAPDGTPRGTRHLRYDEIAAHVYHRLAVSTDPHDRVAAAKLVQSLTDDELASIAQVDAAAVAVLRSKAAKALQAAALMQQAGGVI